MAILKEKTNKVFYFFYELALLFSFCVLILTPLHIAASRHYNVDKLVGPSSVAFNAPDTSFIVPGDIFPVYRFNPGWTSEIGWVRVTSIQSHEVFVSYNPNEFLWPMGRQGRVVAFNDSMVKVMLGADLGFKSGDKLNLFQDRTLAGKIQLQEIYLDYSLARVLSMPRGTSIEGLTASEFTYVTQVAFFKNPFVTLIEVWLFIFIFMAHCYYFIACKKPILLYLGNWLRGRYQGISKKPFYLTTSILWGIPFIWFMVNFVPRCLIYLSDIVIRSTSPLFHWTINTLDAYTWINENTVTLYIASAAIYLSIIIWKGSSPIMLFWQWVGYKRKEKVIVSGGLRHVFIWLLHLIIFYFFGRTLGTFLTANISASVSLMWPHVHFSWNNLSILLHLPPARVLSLEDSLLIVRYLLWNVTIMGCLFGYWYSVLGYLFGKRIRNLDFTVMGWVTNAICYGPLLGGIIFQMTPPLVGTDPVLAQGPLKYFVLITELVLNLLYTISIWNLGTMFCVMTDKGVRTSGFYSVVRHPSYTLESLMFVMVFFNGLFTGYQWLTIGVFMFTYYVRSEREDQFMAASNPDYGRYKKETPYKFIPGVY